MWDADSASFSELELTTMCAKHAKIWPFTEEN
jgi:hypothetical protein